MSRLFSLSDLSVIGCTEVPVRTPALPRLLSPIFREMTSTRVFFPPYIQEGDTLTNPVVSTMDEFEDLALCGEITSEAMGPAKPHWDLWLDDTGKIRYELTADIEEHLRTIFKNYCWHAKHAFSEGNWKEAQARALVARSANPGHLDPLIIRAAAETKLGQNDQCRFTERIASEMISPEEFKAAVAAWIQKNQPTSPIICSAMHQATIRRPSFMAAPPALATA